MCSFFFPVVDKKTGSRQAMKSGNVSHLNWEPNDPRRFSIFSSLVIRDHQYTPEVFSTWICPMIFSHDPSETGGVCDIEQRTFGHDSHNDSYEYRLVLHGLCGDQDSVTNEVEQRLFLKDKDINDININITPTTSHEPCVLRPWTRLCRLAFHTHPVTCLLEYRQQTCGIPSTDDILLFLRSYVEHKTRVHVVFSFDGVYIVSFRHDSLEIKPTDIERVHHSLLNDMFLTSCVSVMMSVWWCRHMKKLLCSVLDLSSDDVTIRCESYFTSFDFV